MSLVPRGIQGLLRPTSFVLASTLNRFLASATKGAVAFSGGKLGGGLSSNFILIQVYFYLDFLTMWLFFVVRLRERSSNTEKDRITSRDRSEQVGKILLRFEHTQNRRYWSRAQTEFRISRVALDIEFRSWSKSWWNEARHARVLDEKKENCLTLQKQTHARSISAAIYSQNLQKFTSSLVLFLFIFFC